MQSRSRLRPLICSQPCPVGAARLSRRHGAGSSSHAMQDRPIERLINNLMVGHPGPLLNTTNLTDRVREVAFDRIAVLNGNAA